MLMQPNPLDASRACSADDITPDDVERLRVELSDAFARARATIGATESQLIAAALFGARPGRSRQARDQRRVA
jgi:hypothetical protein